MKNVTQTTLLSRIERFYDEVPRTGAVGESHGGLTLFVREGAGWPYYARPALGGLGPTADDVRRVRARQRDLAVPEAFEWVDEVTPGLDAAAEEAGLAVRRCPLMVLDPLAFNPAGPPAGTWLRFLDPASDRLAADYATARAVAAVGFGALGTAVGPGGPTERDAALALPSPAEVSSERRGQQAGRIARALLGDDAGALCVGTYQRAGDVAELVGIATLPSARRRGLGVALTAGLASRALDEGTELVFLSANDADVARVYERVGFQRVATACLAEPADD